MSVKNKMMKNTINDKEKLEKDKMMNKFTC